MVVVLWNVITEGSFFLCWLASRNIFIINWIFRKFICFTFFLLWILMIKLMKNISTFSFQFIFRYVYLKFKYNLVIKMFQKDCTYRLTNQCHRFVISLFDCCLSLFECHHFDCCFDLIVFNKQFNFFWIYCLQQWSGKCG